MPWLVLLRIPARIVCSWKRIDELDWNDPDDWDSSDWEFLEPPDLDKWWPEAIDTED